MCAGDRIERQDRNGKKRKERSEVVYLGQDKNEKKRKERSEGVYW